MQKKVLVRCLLALPLVLALSQPVQARNDNRLTKGAVIGGVLGLAAGNGLKGALGGAAIGGGLAAVSSDGYRGRRAQRGAKKGAVVGAVIGGIAGNGLRGALKGAIAGGAAGAIINH
ncbi:YMGG-like glycine zipper-containing protein [Deefgea sp. CFH1-16]|uniref:YMGG-like glycine zipper-containing protein n=1 Tax=Deefgea sp. CFH1-16 TaxID=2675457 RepID=UPI0015F5B406|nr:YMGG-like glycine zipper-containing protein [Deefgea sp. CFH1-16]